MEWSDPSTTTRYRRFIPLSQANTGIIYTAAEFKGFRSFAATFNSFNAGYVTDDDKEADQDQDDASRPDESEQDVRETEGGAPPRATPIQARFQTPDVIPDTKDDDVLLVSNEKLKMEYHERLGHLPFAQLDYLSEQGILPRKLSKVQSPKCPGCIYGKAHRKPWRTKTQPKQIRKATNPGDVVSVDQLQSPIPGFVPIAIGSPTLSRYVGATVFADHASGLTYVHLQTALTTDQTIEAKHAYERFSARHGVTIKHYHCDNGRFADRAFIQAVHAANQTISFCGVGAHHQNGVAERRIRDITESARTMLLHAAHRWPNTIISNLWPQALKHAVNV